MTAAPLTENPHLPTSLEGVDFVVCPHCESHVEVTPALQKQVVRDNEDFGKLAWEYDFSCDWEPCGEEFRAGVSVAPDGPK